MVGFPIPVLTLFIVGYGFTVLIARYCAHKFLNFRSQEPQSLLPCFGKPVILTDFAPHFLRFAHQYYTCNEL